jgi:hypothetical protein
LADGREGAQVCSVGAYGECNPFEDCETSTHHWNVQTQECELNMRNLDCGDSEAATKKTNNALWIQPSGIDVETGLFKSTWNGTVYEPSLQDCEWACADGYYLKNGVCVSSVKEVDCDTSTTASGKPRNAFWVQPDGVNAETGLFKSTWNGTAYKPTSADCKWGCSDGYHAENGNCLSNTREVDCTGTLDVTTAVQNGTSNFVQKWENEKWSPESKNWAYNQTAGECTYVCRENYTHSDSADTAGCIALTRVFTCAAKPDNAVWNTVSSYQQTWTGSSWYPADSATVYNETSGTTSCRYKCAETYLWNQIQCYLDYGAGCFGTMPN